MTLEPGSLLAGRYRVVRVLGRGGMGMVAEARNVVTDKRVAIKALHDDVARDPEMSQRLLREATAACRVRHPNVVDVYDVLRDGDAIVLVMELLEGESLRALLDRGRLSISELLAIVVPAMHGVAEAHRQGVIHRDVHPGNIFLAKESSGARTPQVLDFGISKIGGDAQQGGLDSLTRSGTTMGTPLYMSYEQLLSARDVDVRTDVYSFGVLLYEGLTGQVPYDGDNFAAIAMQIMNGNPVPPRELNPALPAELEGIVLRAMARNREDRIASMDALIAALMPFLELGTRQAAPWAKVPVAPAGDAPTRRVDTHGRISSPLAHSAPPQAGFKPRRMRALLGGMAAGAVVAAIGAVAVFQAQQERGSARPVERAAVVVPSLPSVPTARAPLASPPDAGPELPMGIMPPPAVEAAQPREAARAQPKARPKVERAAAPAEDDPTPGARFRAGRARREDF